ncbi:unnamed protein product [Brassica oleracea]
MGGGGGGGGGALANHILVYGTLKSNHPNHFLLEDLISKNDAVYVG